MNKLVKLAVVVGVLVSLVSIAYYVGATRVIPEGKFGTNRISARINDLRGDRASQADSEPNLDKAIDISRQADVEEANYRDKLAHGSGNCPENSHWDDDVEQRAKTMELVNCEIGKPVPIVLHESDEAEVYAVKLFKFAAGTPTTPRELMVGKALVGAEAEPELSAIHGLAEQIAPGVWKLKGRPRLTYRGNADVLELLRVDDISEEP